MRKIQKGQRVYWNDPAGETSGEYEVYNAPEMEDGFSGMKKSKISTIALC